MNQRKRTLQVMAAGLGPRQSFREHHSCLLQIPDLGDRRSEVGQDAEPEWVVIDEE